jgi:hypothetical protein
MSNLKELTGIFDNCLLPSRPGYSFVLIPYSCDNLHFPVRLIVFNI